MVIETGLIVGYVAAWALRKAKRIGGQLDAEVDSVLDSGVSRLHDAVAAKLGNDPALTQLSLEVAEAGEPSALTRQRLELSLQAAADDPEFVARVTALLQTIREADPEAKALRPTEATAVNGNVTILGIDGGVAAWRTGDVHMDRQRPPSPRAPGR